jgi:hypothetical protein
VQAVGGAFGAEDGVGEGCRALVVGTDVPGTHEGARGGAAEVDRAQVADVEGQVRLPVGGDAVRFAAPNGQQVAVALGSDIRYPGIQVLFAQCIHCVYSPLHVSRPRSSRDPRPGSRTRV